MNKLVKKLFYNEASKYEEHLGKDFNTGISTLLGE